MSVKDFAIIAKLGLTKIIQAKEHIQVCIKYRDISMVKYMP